MLERSVDIGRQHLDTINNFAEIEGKRLRGITEISPDKGVASHLSDIAWKSASLVFEPVMEYQMPGTAKFSSPSLLYTAELTFETQTGSTTMADLSLTTDKDKPIFFTGVRNGFYAYDPLIDGKKDPFYVIGVQPDTLEADITSLSAIWHLQGHTLLYQTNADTQLLHAAMSGKKKDSPDIRQIEVYNAELAKYLPKHLRQQDYPRNSITRQFLGKQGFEVQRESSLFNERNAWAAGHHLVQSHNYPTGFTNSRSYVDYAKLCLRQYTNFYHDARFLNGIKK